MPDLGDGDRRGTVPSVVVLSHELRSLLAAMTLGLSDLNKQIVDDCRTDRMVNDIAIIDTAVRRATELTAWVLSNATETRTHERRERLIDVAHIVNETAWDLRTVVAAHPITVTAPAHLFLTADRILVRAIVTNLILTAAQRANNGSPIEVDARRADTDVEVSVATPAWHPTEEELTELFRPFNARESVANVDVVDLRVASDRAVRVGGSLRPVVRDDGVTAVTLQLPLQPKESGGGRAS
jgi:K+-sensing histidine kinase KdpD